VLAGVQDRLGLRRGQHPRSGRGAFTFTPSRGGGLRPSRGAGTAERRARIAAARAWMARSTSPPSPRDGRGTGRTTPQPRACGHRRCAAVMSLPAQHGDRPVPASRRQPQPCDERGDVLHATSSSHAPAGQAAEPVLQVMGYDFTVFGRFLRRAQDPRNRSTAPTGSRYLPEPSMTPHPRITTRCTRTESPVICVMDGQDNHVIHERHGDSHHVVHVKTGGRRLEITSKTWQSTQAGCSPRTSPPTSPPGPPPRPLRQRRTRERRPERSATGSAPAARWPATPGSEPSPSAPAGHGKRLPRLLAAALRPASTRMTSRNALRRGRRHSPRSRSRCAPGHTGRSAHHPPQEQTDMESKTPPARSVTRLKPSDDRG